MKRFDSIPEQEGFYQLFKQQWKGPDIFEGNVLILGGGLGDNRKLHDDEYLVGPIEPPTIEQS